MTIPQLFGDESFEYRGDEAQSIFETWLTANRKVVYGGLVMSKYNPSEYVYWQEYPVVDYVTKKFTGLLVCIEEIKPKECEHPHKTKHTANEYWKCTTCGKKLKAKWEVCE